MTEVIRYEHVDISYKGKRVVHDVSFSVEKGEILGIVGESGSDQSGDGSAWKGRSCYQR